MTGRENLCMHRVTLYQVTPKASFDDVTNLDFFTDEIVDDVRTVGRIFRTFRWGFSNNLFAVDWSQKSQDQNLKQDLYRLNLWTGAKPMKHLSKEIPCFLRLNLCAGFNVHLMCHFCQKYCKNEFHMIVFWKRVKFILV